MIRNLKYYQLLLIAIVIVSVFNAIPYFLKYHTYFYGVGINYNNSISQRAFIENLKHHGISYKIDEQNIVWYTRNDEAEVHEIEKINNQKIVNTIDLDYEITKLKNIGYEVLSFPCLEPKKSMIMWFKK